MKKLLIVAFVPLAIAVLIAVSMRVNACVVNADTLAIQDKPHGSEIAEVHSGDTLFPTGEYRRDPFPAVGVWMRVRVDAGYVTGWVDQRYCR